MSEIDVLKAQLVLAYVEQLHQGIDNPDELTAEESRILHCAKEKLALLCGDRPGLTNQLAEHRLN